MPIKRSDEKIKQYLLEKNLVPPNKIEVVAERMLKSGRTIEQELIKEKIFSPQQFNELKAVVFGLPAMDLSEIEIDPKVLNLIPQKVAQNYQVVIFGKTDDNIIKVGMVNPDDFKAHEAINFLASQNGLVANYYSVSEDDFLNMMNRYSGFKKEIGKAMESAKLKFDKRTESLKVSGAGEEDLEEVIKTAPVAKIVSVIIKHAMEGGASDIHIEPGRTEGRVRYRIDGVLHSSLTLPNYLYDAVVSRIKVLSNLKLDETRKPQDGRIRVQMDNQEADLRISVLPTLDQEKVVMRVLDTSTGLPSLAELGFEPYHIEIIERNIKKPHGLFLLTGPTGSGKTTTLYSVLTMLNSDEVNISTLEDPIEYYLNGINQSQVNSDVGFTFASGLRALLRQDPNIMMVGEIRDSETAELAIHASLTGHLVFSTLHTNDAWGSIPRMIDMKAEPFLLSSTLNVVMAQRLVRKVCPECKQETKLSPKVQAEVQAQLSKIPDIFLANKDVSKIKFFHGVGCADCSNTGYTGRTVVAEILEISQGLRDLIARDFSYQEVQEEFKKQNYITLLQDGLLKATRGITSVEEVIRVSKE
ncbi:MAG TPA: ATPase, T2SS/T4P/T4SS family [bacterium]|nr:ATPase, T2SS/T4P/T4SS family [bacterium]HNS34331.1 ATPase, T2SS/T4P/T4SS family [bacterium]HNZ73583.1 ATPase, T2SS/T4P/T4SS family [bacterium]HOH67552.1 ATPase, T2SS/T4P/T4SS family [bacterium]HQA64018.1 ATPase, T2SS/T4P/T4SS family [bacterium]